MKKQIKRILLTTALAVPLMFGSAFAEGHHGGAGHVEEGGRGGEAHADHVGNHYELHGDAGHYHSGIEQGHVYGGHGVYGHVDQYHGEHGYGYFHHYGHYYGNHHGYWVLVDDEWCFRGYDGWTYCRQPDGFFGWFRF